MKILFIEPCHVDFGGYFRAYNISLSLSKKKVKVHLLCAAKAKFQLYIKKTIINDSFTQYELPRFYVHFFFNGRILRAILALWFGIIGNYDIIHAAVPVQLESNIPAFLLKLFGKKVVMDWDDYWEGSPIYGEYKIMKNYVAFCEKNAPGYFHNMVVVSDFLYEKAEERGAKKVLKLINAVNTKQFLPHRRKKSRKKLGLDLSGKYLITFGNTYANNRAQLLFRFFENIMAKFPEVTLIFNLDPKKVLQENKIDNKVPDTVLKKILYVGNIPQQDLGYYLGAADAVIFIMGDSDAERACFPIRIGSYINGEAVIIMNDSNTEAANTLKKYNCVIIDKDLNTLAEKAIAYLKNPSLRNTYRQKIIHTKEQLSWDKQITKLISFYNTL